MYTQTEMEHVAEGTAKMSRQRGTRTGGSSTASLRRRVATAFRKIARAIDERAAQHKTRDFYRSSGFAWTSSLN